MRKTELWKQGMIMLVGILVIIFTAFVCMVQVYGKVPVKTEGEKPSHRVATGERISCLNMWAADGTASSAPMRIYYSETDGGIEAPQVIYVRDSNVNTVFCIRYGSQLSSGNGIEACSEAAYQGLNDMQKKGISQVLGCATMRYAPRDGEGGYNVINTGACTMQNFRLYNSTQLMIWYYIDLYSGNVGGGNTGGITWEGVVRTCQAGWGDLQECERIRASIEGQKVIPSFCSGNQENASAIELTYHSDTDTYEIVLTDINGVLNGYNNIEGNGIECIPCNADGTYNPSGNSVLLRTAGEVSEEEAVTMHWQRSFNGGSVLYLRNQSEPQDLAFFQGTVEEEVHGYLKVFTEHRPTVEIVKQDGDTQELLPGVDLQLWEEGTLVAEWTTTAEAYSLQLQVGHTYRLHEVRAGEGYEQAEDIIFTVADSTRVQSIIMENYKIEIPPTTETPPTTEEVPPTTEEVPTTETTTTEARLKEDDSTEITTERATAVAGAYMEREMQTPITGDSALPSLCFAGFLISGVLFSTIWKKK